MPATHTEGRESTHAPIGDGSSESVATVAQEHLIIDPGLWPRLRRRLWLPLLLAILLGALGFYLGHRRAPNYTATVRITIGNVTSRTDSLPNYTEAAQNLAQSYALIIRSPKVLVPLARTEHSTVAAMAQAVSATAIEDSTVFAIFATSPNRSTAIKLAGAAAAQARKTIDAQNSVTAQAATALRLYRQYAVEAGKDRQVYQSLRKSLAKSLRKSLRGSQTGTTTRTPPVSTPLANAEANLGEAQAKMKVYNLKYQALLTTNPQYEVGTLTTIQPARSATSDKQTYVQRYVVLGLAAGLVLGILIALVVPLRRRRSPAVVGDAQ